ncbi:unnamed protein product [Paramecium sonneborni]|uniref:Uncharacterized protein n=1 Tax=Paramecium sonneborni TaxID=65129 RepID=A0A8S1RM90_9CILI|nr:unnamed protein product [Paramecium sonneborni]
MLNLKIVQKSQFLRNENYIIQYIQNVVIFFSCNLHNINFFISFTKYVLVRDTKKKPNRTRTPTRTPTPKPNPKPNPTQPNPKTQTHITNPFNSILIEKEQDIKCTNPNHLNQPILMVILDQNHYQNRLLCSLCLQGLETIHKTMGFSKAYQIILENHQEISKIRNILINDNIQQLDQFKSNIIQLKSFLNQELDSMIEIAQNWENNNFNSLNEDLLIKNELKVDNEKIEKQIKDLNNQWAQKLNLKLEQFKSFKYYSECEKILNNFKNIDNSSQINKNGRKIRKRNWQKKKILAFDNQNQLIQQQKREMSNDDINEQNINRSCRCYRVINEKRNSLLISLVKCKRNKNRSFVGKLLEMPTKQRRKSYQEGVIGQKMDRLNCLYPESICLQHTIQKVKIENKSTLRKAVKRASMMMSTVKYWKDHSQKKIEVGGIIKCINNKESCLSDGNALTSRSIKKCELPPVLLNQFRMRKNEGLIKYSRDRTADKTKSVSQHFSNMQTLSTKAFSSRYSIQNVYIRIKQ